MVGGCQKKEPGAGMDASLGLVKVYKDGYFHLRCMMDKMEQAADYHDELQREHKYNVHTNVSIVRYTDRVDVEKQQSMTPSICFEFCRTVPDMLHFGLVNGRDCYCAPYYMQGPGDGVCDAGCEGDSSVTCGNTNGMSDMYEMHSSTTQSGMRRRFSMPRRWCTTRPGMRTTTPTMCWTERRQPRTASTTRSCVRE